MRCSIPKRDKIHTISFTGYERVPLDLQDTIAENSSSGLETENAFVCVTQMSFGSVDHPARNTIAIRVFCLEFGGVGSIPIDRLRIEHFFGLGKS